MFAVLTEFASALHSPFAVTIDELVLIVVGMRRISPRATLRTWRPSRRPFLASSFRRLSRSSVARVLKIALSFVVPSTEAVPLPPTANAARRCTLGGTAAVAPPAARTFCRRVVTAAATLSGARTAPRLGAITASVP